MKVSARKNFCLYSLKLSLSKIKFKVNGIDWGKSSKACIFLKTIVIFSNLVSFFVICFFHVPRFHFSLGCVQSKFLSNKMQLHLASKLHYCGVQVPYTLNFERPASSVLRKSSARHQSGVMVDTINTY